MPVIDVIDTLYVPVPAVVLAEVLCDERHWSHHVPGLSLRCFDDRGARGKRWTVGGEVEGTAEIWLEEMPEGTVVHFFLQAEPARPCRRRAATRTQERLAGAVRRWVAAERERLDVGRPVGVSPGHVPSPPGLGRR